MNDYYRWLNLKSLRLAVAALTVGVLASAAVAAPERHETKRPDGSTINWYLDRPENARAGIIILAQGSGCQSALASKNLAVARKAFPGFAALMVDKYGVGPGDDPADPFDKGCSETFRAHHTMGQRVADYKQVLTPLRDETWWDGKIVLFGGSEGGGVAARLAPEIDADAAVLLSTGGGVTFGEMVRQSIMDEMARNAVPKDQWPPVDEAFRKARENPQSSEVWAGSSYRFWADAIDRRAVDAMLLSKSALLLIQGGKDDSTPVANARSVADLFAKNERCNLTYWEFPSFDHGMVDLDGRNRMSEVLSLSAAWVNTQLAQGRTTASCAAPK